jgi:hypothetical protein
MNLVTEGKGSLPFIIPGSEGGETHTSISFNNTRYLLKHSRDKGFPETLQYFLNKAKQTYKASDGYGHQDEMRFGGRRKSKRYFRKRRKTRRRKKRLTSS